MPATLDPINLTPGQQEVMDLVGDKNYNRIVWVAPVRRGKTAGCAMFMVETGLYNLVYGYGNHQYILGGVTAPSVERNMGDYFDQYCGKLGLKFKMSINTWTIGDPTIMTFHVFGGEKANAYRPVNGVTAHTAFVDEATLVHKDFISTVEERCSFEDSKLLLGMNAADPYHWIRTEVMGGDETPEKTYVVQNVFENQHFSDERWEDLKSRENVGHLFKRNMENVWASAAGLVFPIEPETMVCKLTREETPKTGIVSADGGTGGTTAALLWKDNVIVDEYVWDVKKHGLVSDATHAQNLKNKWKFTTAIVDPAASGLKTALMDAGYDVRNAKNDIDKGIQTTVNALHEGRFKINETLCKVLLGQCSAYVYNETTGKPVKLNDHAPDAMRYGAMDLYPMRTGGIY